MVIAPLSLSLSRSLANWIVRRGYARARAKTYLRKSRGSCFWCELIGISNPRLFTARYGLLLLLLLLLSAKTVDVGESTGC